MIVVLDSLRYDSAMRAIMPNFRRLGPVEQRWSYATWTAPSHYNLLMGLLPHENPRHVYASDYYTRDFLRYRERMGLEQMDFRAMLPSIYLPTYLRNVCGYETTAMVSMPVLNRHVPLNRDFDRYELMARHNDMRSMLDELHFDSGRPQFVVLNVGETHYPYALPDEDPSEWPRIAGVHGTFRHLDDLVVGGKVTTGQTEFFRDAQLEMLRDRQVRAASYVDGVLGQLFDTVPAGTWIVVTSDHGELFGENGFFGHGPVFHEKVLEVPFVEGLLR